MHAYLHCLSHSPLVGYVDPAQEVLDEVNGVIASARERIAAFSPELVVLSCARHYESLSTQSCWFQSFPSISPGGMQIIQLLASSAREGA